MKRDDIDIELLGNDPAVTDELREKDRTGLVRQRTRRTGRFDCRVMLPSPHQQAGLLRLLTKLGAGPASPPALGQLSVRAAGRSAYAPNHTPAPWVVPHVAAHDRPVDVPGHEAATVTRQTVDSSQPPAGTVRTAGHERLRARAGGPQPTRHRSGQERARLGQSVEQVRDRGRGDEPARRARRRPGRPGRTGGRWRRSRGDGPGSRRGGEGPRVGTLRSGRGRGGTPAVPAVGALMARGGHDGPTAGGRRAGDVDRPPDDPARDQRGHDH